MRVFVQVPGNDLITLSSSLSLSLFLCVYLRYTDTGGADRGCLLVLLPLLVLSGALLKNDSGLLLLPAAAHHDANDDEDHNDDGNDDHCDEKASCDACCCLHGLRDTETGHKYTHKHVHTQGKRQLQVRDMSQDD